MKRILSAIVALVIVLSCLSFAACNKPGEPSETLAPTEAPTGKPTEKPTEAPTEKPTNKPTEAPEVTLDDMLSELIDAYAGKRLSVFGDSISTYDGISNSTEYNTTIANNAVYYSGSNCGLTSETNTYWGRFAERVGTRLCVDNAWSGDSLRSGRFLNRAKNLHNDTGNVDINPDLILVYFGINDLWSGNNSVAQPNGELNDLMKNRGDKTEKEVFDEWFADTLAAYEAGTINTGSCNWDELYALLIHIITTTYTDAKVVCVGLTVNTNNNYKDCTELVPKHNESMLHITKHFGALYVDQYSAINESNLKTYMGDGAGSYLHPNSAGHGVLFEEIVKVLYADLKK